MTTIQEFLKRFPNEEACTKELIKLRNDKCCGKLYRIKSRQALVCACGKHISLKKGTIFEKSSTSLWNWHYAMFRLTGKPGVSAKQLQREIGVTYKCAWRMLHKIREIMREDLVLEGVVEADEAYIGGKGRIWGSDSYKTPQMKDVVFGLIERKGKIKTYHLPAINNKLILKAVRKSVKKGATVYTDGFPGYRTLPKIGYKHDWVEHSRTYVNGDVHTNYLEGYWAKLKGGLWGTYFGVSSKHLQKYLSEFSFRYNHEDAFSALQGRLLV